MAGEVDGLIKMLYEMIEDAKGLPLGMDRCILERDKALDLLDEIKAQLPLELGEAEKLINARTDYIASTKREADQIKRQAEEQARQMISQDSTILTARQKGQEIIYGAEERARELRQAANEYCEDTLRRTEEAVAAAYDEIKRSRAKFRAASSGAAQQAQRGNVPYDAEKES